MFFPGACAASQRSAATAPEALSLDKGALVQIGASSIEDICAMLIPDCDPTILEHFKREGVLRGFDLVALDKDDLAQVGLNMSQRARVLRMAEQFVPMQAMMPVALRNRSASIEEVESKERLDAAESNPVFWCSIIDRAVVDSGSKLSLPSTGEDVRENVLEMLFDLTPERVREVYQSIDRDADGSISAAELMKGLIMYKLPQLKSEDLQKILNKVGGPSMPLHLLEFEAILSRLKIAQVLHAGADAASGNLTVIDYSVTTAFNKRNLIKEEEVKEFLFGHRPEVGGLGLVRWVHLHHLSARHLLAMMVKYSLHPLGVEDVFEQTGTKMERYGNHFFITIEQLSLQGEDKTAEGPVFVQARHVSVFCAGPPYLDTIITVLQDDRSFTEDWCGASPREGSPGSVHTTQPYNEVRWVHKLQQRLAAKSSRLRDRRATYVLKDIVDLSADDLVNVIRAYALRLTKLEVEAKSFLNTASLDIVERTIELEQAALQLQVVRRRVNSLQRALRQLHHHLDDDLAGYFQDIRDHLDEANEDVTHLIGRTGGILNRYDQVQQRTQDTLAQESNDRLNKTLFVLTVATTIFAPVQFLAGVYGMNFVDEDGEPTIPELRWKYGYSIFWFAVTSYLILSIAFVCWLFRHWHLRNKSDEMDSLSGMAYYRRLTRRNSPVGIGNGMWIGEDLGSARIDTRSAL